MRHDRADIFRLTFSVGLHSVFDAWAGDRRAFASSMLPLACAAIVMLGSFFMNVLCMVALSSVVMVAMAALIVERAPSVDQKALIYLPFLISGFLVLGFAVFHGGASALIDAPVATISIVAFMLFGGLSLVGLVRVLGHV